MLINGAAIAARKMNLWVSTSHHDVNAKSQTYLFEVHMKKVDV